MFLAWDPYKPSFATGILGRGHPQEIDVFLPLGVVLDKVYSVDFSGSCKGW